MVNWGDTRLPERIWNRIAPCPMSGCWLWTGSTHTKGYGYTSLRGRARAHRLTYEVLVAPIPHGLVLDHKCRVRCCVNPAHLEPVTHRVNLMRGETLAAANANKSVCVNGHEFTPENTFIHHHGPNRAPTRGCIECRRQWGKKKAS